MIPRSAWLAMALLLASAAALSLHGLASEVVERAARAGQLGADPQDGRWADLDPGDPADDGEPSGSILSVSDEDDGEDDDLAAHDDPTARVGARGGPWHWAARTSLVVRRRGSHAAPRSPPVA